jgi:ABC-type branched-subunit amino acid transport system substrate-binding protein
LLNSVGRRHGAPRRRRRADGWAAPPPPPRAFYMPNERLGMCPLVLLLLVSSASASPPAVVRLGGLFPKFRVGSDTPDTSGVRRLTAFVQAIHEINNKSDGVADHLLPRTQLLFATRDSKRDVSYAYDGARSIARDGFGGLGISGVVGAASSGPSSLAALALAYTRTPQISYSSTSAQLSDGTTYPYFLRTPPSDAFQARGLVELAASLFSFSRLGLVASTSSYGTAGAAAVRQEMTRMRCVLVADITIVANRADHTQSYAQLAASGAKVIILFLGTYDGATFLGGAYDHGLVGPGYIYLGSDGVVNPSAIASITELSRRAAVWTGLFGLAPSIGQGTPNYNAYVARMRALRSTVGNGTHCDLERDDDGGLLWAADHDDDPATPLVCAGSDNQVEGTYAPYACACRARPRTRTPRRHAVHTPCTRRAHVATATHTLTHRQRTHAHSHRPRTHAHSTALAPHERADDATFALAHALHHLIEVQNASAIDGDALLEALVQQVSFDGVTGPVAFRDAASHPTRFEHGDRLGTSYDVRNYHSNALCSVFGSNHQHAAPCLLAAHAVAPISALDLRTRSGLVTVGQWTPCTGCSFADEWVPNGESLIYSTVKCVARSRSLDLWVALSLSARCWLARCSPREIRRIVTRLCSNARPLDGTAIALLAPLPSLNDPSRGADAGHLAAATCAALLAARHANQRNGTVVAALAAANPLYEMRTQVRSRAQHAIT